jgi:hypothetical protein
VVLSTWYSKCSIVRSDLSWSWTVSFGCRRIFVFDCSSMYGSENNVVLLNLGAFFRDRGVIGGDIDDGFIRDVDG